MTRNFGGYFIDTGSKGVMFTLRQFGVIPTLSDGGGSYETSYYIQTLAGNIKDAIDKAEKLTGYKLPDPYLMTNPRGERHAKKVFSSNTIPVGKYRGTSIETMLEDLQYTMWFIDTFGCEPEYDLIIERLLDTDQVQTELKRIETEKIAFEELVKKTEKESEIECAKSQFVGKIGDRIEVTATINKIISGDGQWGSWYLTLMTDNDGNRLAYFNTIKLTNPPENRSYNESEEGDIVTFVATVKDHAIESDFSSGYNFNQTMFSRAKKGVLINAS